MNRRFRAAAAAAGVAALLSACAARPAPAPPAAAAAAEAPPPAPAEPLPAPPSGEADWRDRPLTPGDWSYARRGDLTEARFGPEGGSSFRLSCAPGNRRIQVERQGASGALGVRTTYGQRTLPQAAGLDPADPVFDEMAFSRGRFAVEIGGADTLIVPAWPELARVVEDCRG